MTNTFQPQTSSAPRLGADLERAFAALDFPACVIDGDGELLWANRDVAALLDLRPGDSFLGAVPEELHDAARARLARTLRGVASSMHRLELRRRDGRRIQALVRSSPVHRDDTVVGALVMVFPLRTLRICRTDHGQPLTPRQEQVLRLLAEGHDTEQIAERLGVALETARNHIRALLSRLEVHSRLGAVIEGLRRGVLSLDELGA
jgi:DNA-binding CsgD family transcriptional regulator